MNLFISRRFWDRRQKNAPIAPQRHDKKINNIKVPLDSDDPESAKQPPPERSSFAETEGNQRILRARVQRMSGNPKEALTLCEQALEFEVDICDAHIEMAECHRALHDLQAALDMLGIATTANASSRKAWSATGEILLKLGCAEEALNALYKASACVQESDKDTALLQFHMGQAENEVGNFSAAHKAYRTCIELDPSLPAAHIALGHFLLRDGDEFRALECYESAVKLSPALKDAVRLNTAIAFVNIGRYAEARSHLNFALGQNPSNHTARWYLSQLDLLHCRWKEGWANFQARFGAGSAPYRPMPYRPWRGEPLGNDILLVLADQGLGDEIMFASCFKDLQQVARHCIIECEPRLLALFERSFPDFQFISTKRENNTEWLKGVGEPKWQIPASDLPVLFRQSEADFPQRRTFLHCDPAKRDAWKERLFAIAGSRLKVGISWRGGILGTRAKARSIAVEEWTPLLRTAGIEFFNLQYGEVAIELENMHRQSGVQVHHFPDAIADYDETAALVSSLDLVISVCTAVVHLGGALGTPVWVLAPYAPGWRYTAYRESMPWYSSTRIFRQPAPGDWPAACKNLSHALFMLTNNVAQHEPKCDKTPETIVTKGDQTALLPNKI